jgi:hypothetical protein
VAGVRGTTFRVDASKDRSVVVRVYSGTVAVASGPIPRPEHAGAAGEGQPSRDAATPDGQPAQAGGAPDARPDQAGAAPDRGGKAAGGKRERRQVAGPHEVTREQWERIVTTMMQVRVAADGTPAEPEQFALAKADEWETWNRERDAASK